MPSRVLRDITDSERVDLLSANAEVLMYRIFMKADDFGSYYANPKLIKSACYPLKDNVREPDISRWMDELLKAGLIAVYQVGTKQYLRVVNFGQRLRNMRNVFPAPDSQVLPYEKAVRKPPQVAASRSKSPPETKKNETELHFAVKSPQVAVKSPQVAASRSNSPPETETETEKKPPIVPQKEGRVNGLLKNSNAFRQPTIPSKQDVLRVFLQNGGTKEMAKTFYEKNEGLGWFLNNSPIKNFASLVPSYVSSWKENRKNIKHESSSPPLKNANELN